jgi:hypothetical protein
MAAVERREAFHLESRFALKRTHGDVLKRRTVQQRCLMTSRDGESLKWIVRVAPTARSVIEGIRAKLAGSIQTGESAKIGENSTVERNTTDTCCSSPSSWSNRNCW